MIKSHYAIWWFYFYDSIRVLCSSGQTCPRTKHRGSPSITTTHNACKWVLQNNSPKKSTLLLKGISTIHFGALLVQFAKSHVSYGFAWNWHLGKHPCTQVHLQTHTLVHLLQHEWGKAQILNRDDKSVLVFKFKYRLHRTESAASTKEEARRSFALLSHPFVCRQRAELLSYQGCDISCTLACSKTLTAVPAHGRELLPHRSYFAARVKCTVRQRLQRGETTIGRTGDLSPLLPFWH